MEKEKNVIFEAFARKAAERIEERKKLRTMRLMVKSVGMEVEIRGLTEEEIRDCMDFPTNPLKWTIYDLHGFPNTAECGEDPCGGRHVETAL